MRSAHVTGRSTAFLVEVQVTAQHDRLAAEAALYHPVGERGVEVEGVARKPVRQGRCEAPAFGDVALPNELQYLAHRRENGRVLVDVAGLGRKIGALHPLVFFREMSDRMPLERFEP